MDERLDDFAYAVRFVMSAAYSDGYSEGRGDAQRERTYRASYADDFVLLKAAMLRDLCLAALTESEREAITCAYVNSITDPHRAAVLAERDKTETDASS